MLLRYEEVKHWMPCAVALERFNDLFPVGAPADEVIAAFDAIGRPEWSQYVKDHAATTSK